MGEILLIDDDERGLRATRNLLIDCGHSVTGFTAAGDALKLLGHGHFDLVICDYNLPGMSGMELLRRLRQIKNNVPFILYSGELGIELGHTCRGLDAAFFLKGRPGLEEKVAKMLATAA